MKLIVFLFTTNIFLCAFSELCRKRSLQPAAIIYLELFSQPSLFKNCISSMTWFNFWIYWKILIWNRAEPNIMIPFSMSFESTSILTQYLYNFLWIIIHKQCLNIYWLLRMELYFHNQHLYLILTIPELIFSVF